MLASIGSHMRGKEQVAPIKNKQIRSSPLMQHVWWCWNVWHNIFNRFFVSQGFMKPNPEWCHQQWNFISSIYWKMISLKNSFYSDVLIHSCLLLLFYYFYFSWRMKSLCDLWDNVTPSGGFTLVIRPSSPLLSSIYSSYIMFIEWEIHLLHFSW